MKANNRRALDWLLERPNTSVKTDYFAVRERPAVSTNALAELVKEGFAVGNGWACSPWQITDEGVNAREEADHWPWTLWLRKFFRKD